MTIDQLIPSYRRIHRWWNWRLALLKPFSYQFYRGHVSCCYSAQPRRALSAKGTEVCLDPESPWPAGQRSMNGVSLKFSARWLSFLQGELSCEFTSLGHHTLVAGKFLAISWEALGLLLVLHNTSSLWSGCSWAVWLSMRTKVKGQSSLHSHHHSMAANQASRS